jgi:hypothetical protein
VVHVLRTDDRIGGAGNVVGKFGTAVATADEVFGE